MKKIFSFTLALLVYIALFAFVISRSTGELDFGTYSEFANAIAKGWLTTVLLSLVSIVLALIFGLFLYLMQESKNQFLYYLAEILKIMMFSTPLVVIAIVSYYYVSNAFNIDNRLVVGALTLGAYISTYIADVYKGAIESIHQNQWQAAKMFGFNKYQTYRYIIFPQVFKSILPPLAGQFALTVKGSSLLGYIGTAELFNRVNSVMAASFQYDEGFIIMTLGYWIVTIPLILLVRKLEKKANYSV
jgi:polar amino acid transport system permease protein